MWGALSAIICNLYKCSHLILHNNIIIKLRKLQYQSGIANCRVQILNPDLTFHSYTVVLAARAVAMDMQFNGPHDTTFDSKGISLILRDSSCNSLE